MPRVAVIIPCFNDGLDCVHFPAAQPVPRLLKGLPTVVSVHGIQHETFPQHFSFGQRQLLHASYGFAVRRSGNRGSGP